MAIGRVGGGVAPGDIQSEWRQKADAPDVKKEVKNESFGSALNRMGGVAAENSALYKNKNEMTKEAYLKMLMEQLKFQDPFNPVKNEQFSQQMTSLSQLEQQVNTNKNLEKLVGQNQNTQLGALQLVGKDIAADRAAIYHDLEKPSPIQFKLPQDSDQVLVHIMDSDGQTIRTMNMGSQNQGDLQTKWDGAFDNGQPAGAGRYTYRIEAQGMDGKSIDIATRVEGRVTGVTSSHGVTFLLVGDQRIGLNDVETIKESAGPAPSVPRDAGNLANATNPAGTKSEAVSGSANSPEQNSGNPPAASGPAISVSPEATDNLAGALEDKPRLDAGMPVFLR